MHSPYRWNWPGLTALVWCGLVLGLAVFGFLYPWSHTVYDIYARAGRAWWSGANLYACESTAYFRYSPLFAVGVSPLAMLPESWGNALWRLVNCLVYAAGLWAWGQQVLPAQSRRFQLAALFLLVLPLSLHSMYNAQANLFMIGCVLLGLAAAQADKWNRAAGWLALGTLIKGYPLALGLLLLALQPRRFAIRYVAALAIGLLLPFAAQHPAIVMSQYASWWSHLLDSTSIMRERLRSLDHLVAISGYSLSPHAWLVWQLSAGISVLVLCIFHVGRTRDTHNSLTFTFLLYTTWVVLFGPATEASTYVVIAPVMAWALLDAYNRQGTWLLRYSLVLSLLLMGPFTTDLVGSTLRNFANEHGSQPIGALVLLACLVTRQLRSPATEPGQNHAAEQIPVQVAA